MHDKSHTQLQRIRRMETHCKWTLSGNNKCWVPGDSLWTCSMGVIRLRGRAVDQRRESARRRSESARRGGGGGRASRSSVLTSLPDISAGVLWVTSAARLSTRRS